MAFRRAFGTASHQGILGKYDYLEKLMRFGGILGRPPGESGTTLAADTWPDGNSPGNTCSTDSDGNGSTMTAARSPTIVGVIDAPTNTPPIALGESFKTSEHKTLIAGSVLGNDIETDGDPLCVSAVNGSSASVGTQITLTSGALLTVGADGSVAYDPNGAFASLSTGQTTVDGFSYTISDGRGGTSTASAIITIVGEGGCLPVDENIVQLPSGAMIRTNPDGSITYAPHGVFSNLTNDGNETATSSGSLNDTPGASKTDLTDSVAGATRNPPLSYDVDIDAWSYGKHANDDSFCFDKISEVQAEGFGNSADEPCVFIPDFGRETVKGCDFLQDAFDVRQSQWVNSELVKFLAGESIWQHGNDDQSAFDKGNVLDDDAGRNVSSTWHDTHPTADDFQFM